MMKSTFEQFERDGNEHELTQDPLEAIVVLSGPLRERKNPSTGTLEKVLSPETKMRAIAGAQLYEEGATQKLIFSGGRFDSERSISEMMKEYILRKFDIPEEDILIETESANTSENLLEVDKVLREAGVERYTILSSDYHRPRIEQLARNLGIRDETISAEEYLAQRSKHYRKLVDEFEQSPGMKLSKIREAIRRGMIVVDPNDGLIRFVAKLKRQGILHRGDIK